MGPSFRLLPSPEQQAKGLRLPSSPMDCTGAPSNGPHEPSGSRGAERVCVKAAARITSPPPVPPHPSASHTAPGCGALRFGSGEAALGLFGIAVLLPRRAAAARSGALRVRGAGAAAAAPRPLAPVLVARSILGAGLAFLLGEGGPGGAVRGPQRVPAVLQLRVRVDGAVAGLCGTRGALQGRGAAVRARSGRSAPAAAPQRVQGGNIPVEKRVCAISLPAAVLGPKPLTRGVGMHRGM